MPLHELVAARAVKHPERIASVQDGQTMTYGQLDKLSTTLARRLVARYGVKINDVGLVLVACT